MSKLSGNNYFFTKCPKFKRLPAGHVNLQVINYILSEVEHVFNVASELQQVVCPKCFTMHNSSKEVTKVGRQPQSLAEHMKHCQGMCRRCLGPKSECAENGCEANATFGFSCAKCNRRFASGKARDKHQDATE